MLRKKMVTGLLTICLCATFLPSVSFATAKDSDWDFVVTQSRKYTDSRPKDDYTSTYVYYRTGGENYVNASVWNSNNSVNLTYGATSYRVNCGQSRKFPNSVRESGYTRCKLGISGPSLFLGEAVSGKWSSDSV